MAFEKKKDKKKGYEGAKLKGDTREYREERLKRALKNAQTGGATQSTNDVFAASDTAFREACEQAGVPATKRQASKFRNGYGAAARVTGANRRANPERRRAA